MAAAVRTALITGASSGIGRALAGEFARHGWNLILTARRGGRLEELAGQLRGEHGVKVACLPADLADPAAPRHLFDAVQGRGLRVDALVNNAGYGVPGPYHKTDWAEQQAFLQVLVMAVAELTHHFLPAMIERRQGWILNVASLNALLPCSPGQSLYAGAKAFAVSLTQTLAAEVGQQGVLASSLCPGLTYSEFHDVTGTREQVSRVPKSQWLDAETVAAAGYAALMRGDLVCVPGRAPKLMALAAQVLPRATMVRLMARQSARFRRLD